MNRLSEEKRKPALAHVRRNEDGSFEIHDLEDHVCAEVRPMEEMTSDVTIVW